MKAFGSIALFFGLGIAAFGDSVTFTFDKAGAIAALNPATATAADISTYMTAVLQAAGCIGCSVTVTDPTSPNKVYVDSTYTGENHVVGPNGNPVTLGTYEHAKDNTGASGIVNGLDANGAPIYDNFLSNVANSSSNGGSAILMTFSLSAGYSLGNGVSFDYEIFPDAGCQSSTNCPDPAEFEFKAGMNSLAYVNDFGVNGIVTAAFPDGNIVTAKDGVSTKNGGTTQTAAQWISTYSSSNPFASYNQLEFIDWPAAIGVDNLKLNFSRVPETNSILLLGTLALLLTPLVRRFRKA
jgi:hypothetical protein